MKRGRPAWVWLISCFTTVTSLLGLVSLITMYAAPHLFTVANHPLFSPLRFILGCATVVTLFAAGIALYNLNRWAAHLFLAGLPTLLL